MLKRFAIFLLISTGSVIAETSEQETTAVQMTLEQALIQALENNTTLQTRRLDPIISEKNIDIQKATFDTQISANVDATATDFDHVNNENRSATDLSAAATISKKFATGTTVSLGVDADRDESTSLSEDYLNHEDSFGTELKITQSLLRGRGRDVNLASIRKAEINSEITHQQLRRYIETLIYNVTTAYWNLFLEQKKLAVYQESYDLAMDHEREVEVFIKNGKVAEIELAQVKGEVSARREKLIQARGAIDKKRLTLLGILNYNDLTDDAWRQKIDPSDDPTRGYGELESVQAYVNIALQKRPEIRESQLKIDREGVDVVVTKNGLLPKLDFFVAVGRTDYSDSFRTRDDADSSNDSIKFGLSFNYGLGNRAERARYDQYLAREKREELAFDNLQDTISQEVRSAYIDCTTDLDAIDAVAVTRDLREQSLKTQTIKFELGKATNNDIADAQRDLLESQINYTEAVVDYVKARLRLHYLDGSLIERSGIVLP